MPNNIFMFSAIYVHIHLCIKRLMKSQEINSALYKVLSSLYSERIGSF